jgi:hypothetical protein
VATASLATGVYETFNNFAAVAPENPTIFEYFRKDLKRPASDAWVVAPSNGFNRIGESSHRSWVGMGASSTSSETSVECRDDRRPRLRTFAADNYETPLYAPQLSGNDFELQQMEELLKLDG